VEVPATCQAAVLVEYGRPLEIREVPIPEVEPNAILIRVEMAGVCGTDVHLHQGAVGAPVILPVIPGHEGLGRIARLGQGRTHDAVGEPLRPGDRILWSHAWCGRCYWCDIAREPTLCRNATTYGLRQSEEQPFLTGSFAEYEYLVPNTRVVKVPEELSNEEVVGASCAFRTVVSAYDRLNRVGGVGTQDSVVILGAGPIGLYSTLLATEGGAGQTIVVGAPRARLELAREWGADHVINLDEVPDPSQRKAEVLKLTSGRGADVVVEAAGVLSAFGEGLEMVRPGGRYLEIGQTHGAATTPVAPAKIHDNLVVIGNKSATIVHFYKALHFIKNKRHRYAFGKMVSNTYPLTRVNEALASMKAGREIKAAIVP
jgi:L-iditol 2-dehydrogenase